MRGKAPIVRRIVGALLVLVALGAAYFLFANWQLHRWLRTQSAALGCSLEYGYAVTGVPGHFTVQAARLSDCNHGRWSARIIKAEGDVALRSLIWGTVELEHAQLELDSLKFAGLAVDGTLHVTLEPKAERGFAVLRADKLYLRGNGIALANCGRARLAVAGPDAANRGRGSVSFTLQSLASPALGLAAEGPVAGSLERVTWDVQERKLEVKNGRVRPVQWRLEQQLLESTVELEHGSWSPSGATALARLQLRGPDAHVLLEALRAPESLSFALSGLQGVPFTLSSTVDYATDRWTFEDVVLSAEQASAAGFASIRGMHRAAKLRVEYGGVVMGVQFSNEESSVVLDPAESWLSSSHEQR